MIYKPAGNQYYSAPAYFLRFPTPSAVGAHLSLLPPRTDPTISFHRVDRPPTGKVATARKAKHKVELKAMFVVVAPGEEAEPFSCPACKEPMKYGVWKNAVKKDNKVRPLHSTRCIQSGVNGSSQDLPCHLPR